MKQQLARNWPVSLPYALLLAITHAWFVPGLIAGEDFLAPPFLTLTTLAHSGFWPPSIEPLRDFGQNMQAWWPSFPLWAFVGALYRAGVSWTILERLFWLWPFFALAVAAPYFFALRRGVTPAAASVGAALFAVNTWTIGSIERGHIPGLVAYALLPAIVDRFLVLSKGRRSASVAFALLLTVQALYEVRFCYLTVLLCAVLYGCMCIFSRRQYASKRAITNIAVAAGLACVLNVYWWLPLFIAPISVSVDTSMASFIMLSGPMTVWNALALFFPFYHHNVVLGAFIPEPPEWPFFFLPVLATIGYYVGRGRRTAFSFAVAGILTVILLSGPDSVFAPFVRFLYAHFPGFDVFRDITKLFAIAAFVMSFGVALALNRAIAYARVKHIRAQSVVAVAGVVALGILMCDAFNPLRRSNFTTTVFRAQDAKLQAFIDGAPGNGVVMLFPSYFTGVDPSPRHPILSAGTVALGNPPSGMMHMLPSKGRTIPRLLHELMRSRDAWDILARVGVGWVVLVDDPKDVLRRSWLYDVDMNEARRFLDGTPWLRPIERFGSDKVYAVRGARPRRVAYYPALRSSPVFKQMNSSEISGITAPGLLLQESAFDVGWHLALLPPSSEPTGTVFLDYLRFRKDFVPKERHVTVDSDFNGWHTGDRARALLIFAPTAAADLGAIAELPALLLLGFVIRRWR